MFSSKISSISAVCLQFQICPKFHSDPDHVLLTSFPKKIKFVKENCQVCCVYISRIICFHFLNHNSYLFTISGTYSNRRALSPMINDRVREYLTKADEKIEDVLERIVQNVHDSAENAQVCQIHEKFQPKKKLEKFREINQVSSNFKLIIDFHNV